MAELEAVTLAQCTLRLSVHTLPFPVPYSLGLSLADSANSAGDSAGSGDLGPWCIVGRLSTQCPFPVQCPFPDLELASSHFAPCT
jgi:hypothetical protein